MPGETGSGNEHLPPLVAAAEAPQALEVPRYVDSKATASTLPDASSPWQEEPPEARATEVVSDTTDLLASVATEQQDADDDDSIEAYMNRLLQRVHGSSSSAEWAPPASLSSEHPDSAHAKPGRVEPSHTETVVETETCEPETGGAGSDSSVAFDPATPQLPISEAPEKESGFSALRDLANESANSAIARSARIQTRDAQLKALLKFTAAVIALGTGAAAYFWIEGSFRLLGITASLIVASFFLVEACSVLREARRRDALLRTGRLDLWIASQTKSGSGTSAVKDPAAELDELAETPAVGRPEA